MQRCDPVDHGHLDRQRHARSFARPPEQSPEDEGARADSPAASAAFWSAPCAPEPCGDAPSSVLTALRELSGAGAPGCGDCDCGSSHLRLRSITGEQRRWSGVRVAEEGRGANDEERVTRNGRWRDKNAQNRREMLY